MIILAAVALDHPSVDNHNTCYNQHGTNWNYEHTHAQHLIWRHTGMVIGKRYTRVDATATGDDILKLDEIN